MPQERKASNQLQPESDSSSFSYPNNNTAANFIPFTALIPSVPTNSLFIEWLQDARCFSDFVNNDLLIVFHMIGDHWY